jgi:alanyl-tRNA synthetase
LADKEYRQDEETIRAYRIVADHIRTSVFILGDQKGCNPFQCRSGLCIEKVDPPCHTLWLQIGIPEGSMPEIAQAVIDQYKDVYPELVKNEAFIKQELILEEERFQRTIKQGLREFSKLIKRLGKDVKVIDGPKRIPPV